jgi:hypothetical protein
MGKTMCKMDVAKQQEKQVEPKYKCNQCGSVAHKEKHLCKPKKIKTK